MVLGITIFVLFSLGITAFALYEPRRFPRVEPPPNLGRWQPSEDASLTSGNPAQLVEQRLILLEKGWFGRGQIVRQVRVRDRQSGEIVAVSREQIVKGPPWSD